MKGKISEDDPGPLRFGSCGKAPEATDAGCVAYFLADLGCSVCLLIPS
jgi:hypothetical protein